MLRDTQQLLSHNHSSSKSMLSPAFHEPDVGLGARDTPVREKDSACYD